MTPEEHARDLFEEWAAIREYDSGQSRAEAQHAACIEASHAAGVTRKDAWRIVTGGGDVV